MAAWLLLRNPRQGFGWALAGFGLFWVLDGLAQSYVHAGGNPYCWFPGYCSYEAKTAWMTDKAPARKFDKYAQ